MLTDVPLVTEGVHRYAQTPLLATHAAALLGTSLIPVGRTAVVSTLNTGCIIIVLQLAPFVIAVKFYKSQVLITG